MNTLEALQADTWPREGVYVTIYSGDGRQALADQRLCVSCAATLGYKVTKGKTRIAPGIVRDVRFVRGLTSCDDCKPVEI